MNEKDISAGALWLLRKGLALWLLEQGWSIVPVESGGKKEDTALLEAMPFSPVRNNFIYKHATPDELAGWLKDPTINIGALTGATSGITVLDVDTPEAYRMILKLLPKGFRKQLRFVRTARGRHLYFQYIGEFRTNEGKPVPGVDLRNDLGMVVLPFSVHETGVVYKPWPLAVKDGVPCVELPRMPEVLAAWVAEHFAAGPEDDIVSYVDYDHCEDDYGNEIECEDEDDWEDEWIGDFGDDDEDFYFDDDDEDQDDESLMDEEEAFGTFDDPAAGENAI